MSEITKERYNIVNEVQDLLRKTDKNDVTLKYGYMDKKSGKFIECEHDINMDSDKRECVLIKYDAQADEFGRIISMELDGLFWMALDIMKTVNTL